MAFDREMFVIDAMMALLDVLLVVLLILLGGVFYNSLVGGGRQDSPKIEVLTWV